MSTETTRDIVRQLALDLLQDDEGIGESAYNNLYKLLDHHDLVGEFRHKVDATDGRFYIAKDEND